MSQRREDSPGPCRMGGISKRRRGKQHEVSSGEMVNRPVWLEYKGQWEVNERGWGQITAVEKPERCPGWCG